MIWIGVKVLLLIHLAALNMSAGLKLSQVVGDLMSVQVFVAQDIGHTLIDENVWMPTVTIDVSQSPEIADLARVHAVEGVGDVSSHAIRQDDTVVLGVQFNTPVQAIFVVAFSYSVHRDFLYEVADVGTLVFATTNTENAHEERPLWLSVFIDRNDMRQALNADTD